MTLDQDLRRLAAIPTFAMLSTEALRLIAFSAESRVFRAGDVLFRRGDLADGGFVLLHGSVALEGPDPEEATMVGPGVLIGERALIAEGRRASTATAREPSTALKITRRLFYRVLTEFPGTAERLRAAIASDLAGRLQREG